MKGKHLKNVGNNVSVDAEVATKSGFKQSRKEFMLGDIVWTKIHGSLWWPAQVVDETTVVEDKKIKKKMKGGVFTRLYGSNEYVYMDPMKYHSEFQNVLKQSNGGTKEILKKALEQDVHVSGVRGKKRNLSKEKGPGEAFKKPKENSAKKNHKADAQESVNGALESSQAVSARRMRVMQSLGLIAPSGSPFQRNELQKVVPHP